VGLNFPLKFRGGERGGVNEFSLGELQDRGLRSLRKGLDLCNTRHTLV